MSGLQLLTVGGVVWPFVLAAGLLGAMNAGLAISDGVALLTLVASVLGVPAIGALIYRLLPPGWSEVWRITLAVLLTLPLFALEVLLALILFVFGMVWLGFVPA